MINKNYAAMLPWVDWMFGTFYLPKNERTRSYGIDQPISPHLLGQLMDPFMARREALPAGPVAADEGNSAVVSAAIVDPAVVD